MQSCFGLPHSKVQVHLKPIRVQITRALSGRFL